MNLEEELALLDGDKHAKSDATIAPIHSPTEGEDVGVLDRMGRGIDLLQATGGSAIQAAGEIFGSEGLTEYGKEIVEEQRAEADAIAPPAESIADILFESVPAVAPLAASAGTGAAIGSAVPVVGTAVGALVGLGIGAFGLNLGTVKEIEELLDPESEADLGSLVTAGVATIPDILTGGALSSTVKQSVKGATKKQMLKNIAKDTGVGVGAGAANMLALDIGSTLSTTENFDEQRLDSILENTATAALLNGLFATTASGVANVGGRTFRNQELFEQNNHMIELDDNNNVINVREPNPVAIENPSVIEKGGTVLFGRSFDPVLATHGDNIGIREILGEFDRTFAERPEAVDNITVGTEAQLRKSEYKQKSNEFDWKRASLKDRKKVREQVVKGESSPLADATRTAYRDVVKQAAKAGIKMKDLGDTFWPFHPDTTKIKKNKDTFVKEVVDDYVQRGGTEVDGFRVEVNKYVNDLLGDGGVRLGDALNANKLIEDSALALQGDEAAIKRMRSPVTLGRQGTKINKNNNLEMHRKLSQTTPELLNKWAKDTDPLDDLDMYFQGVAERIAFAEKFGANGEKLLERLRLAQVEELAKKGKPIPPDVMQRVIDAANLSQRITSKTVSPTTRQMTRNALALSNLINLGSTVLSSLVEPILILPKTGGRSTLTGLGKALSTAAVKSTRKVGLKGMSKTKLDEFAEDMNTSLREAQSATAGRLGEDVYDITKAEAGMYKWNGLSAWTEFTRLWAQYAVEADIKRVVKGMNEGKWGKRKLRKQARKLAEAGLDPVRVQDWVNNGSDRNHPYYKNIRAATIDVAEDVVFRPTPVRRPAWTTDPTPLLRFMSNLKTYPITYTNRVIVPVAKSLVDNGLVGNMEQGFKTATYLTLITGGYMAQDTLKAAVRGNLDDHEDKDVEQRVLSAVAQAAGGLGIMIDATTSESFGGSAVEGVSGPVIAKGATITASVGGVLTGQIEPEVAMNQLVRTLTPSVPMSAKIKEELLQ